MGQNVQTGPRIGINQAGDCVARPARTPTFKIVAVYFTLEIIELAIKKLISHFLKFLKIS